MARSWLVPVLVCASALGCAPNFDPASKLQSLRVLAVQKDKPYAKPGETVKFSMLLDDASAKAPRPLHIAWLPGFENPAGDAYIGSFLPNPKCSDSKGGALPDPTAIGKIAPGTAIPHEFEQGLEFSMTLAPDIIKCHAPPANSSLVPFGAQFVFFVVCAGDHIGFTGGDVTEFPIGCFTKDNVPLDSNDFVAGYTEVFGYQSTQNANPIVKGFSVDGKSVPVECSGGECVAIEQASLASIGGSPDGGAPAAHFDGGATSDAATSDAGGDAGSRSPSSPLPASKPFDCGSGNDARCIPVCTTANQNNCPKHKIQLELDQADNQEENTVLETQGGGKILEQMWVNYYSDAGKLNRDVKLLNDQETGWVGDHAADLLEPQVRGPFDVWGVAHDNRGGTNWVRIRLLAE